MSQVSVVNNLSISKLLMFLSFSKKIMDTGWHFTEEGGFYLKLFLLTLICAYVFDTQVWVFLLQDGGISSWHCFGTWSLNLTVPPTPPLVCGAGPCCLMQIPVHFSAFGRRVGCTSFQSSLLTGRLGCLTGRRV